MIRIKDIQGSGRSLDVRKMVIKLGSAVVMGANHQVDRDALGALADSVAALRGEGVQVVLVSSGAIGLGRRHLPRRTPRTMPDRQAMAAVGQVDLMHTYATLFRERGLDVAQMLLTRDDMHDRQRYLNARYTLERLLAWGVVPIINENDSVTIEEIRFGDNDELSALVAIKMNADLLVILSIVEGLYRAAEAESSGRRKPKSDKRPEGELISVVECLDDSIMRHATPGCSHLGAGGMAGKLAALEMATRGGVHAVIAPGKRPRILEELRTGRFTGTYFVARDGGRPSSRSLWIAFGRQARGRKLIVDAGAERALAEGKKSLLAAGVGRVEGRFERGDLVEVHSHDDRPIAKGLVNYSSEEMERIKGKKTAQIREILGDLEYAEVIHRDNLVMVD